MGPMRRRSRRRGLLIGAAVGSRMARRSNQAAEQPAAEATPAVNDQDQMAELEKLGQLKTEGILTQAEFDAKKKQILGL